MKKWAGGQNTVQIPTINAIFIPLTSNRTSGEPFKMAGQTPMQADVTKRNAWNGMTMVIRTRWEIFVLFSIRYIANAGIVF
jgi:hypothetical protein